MIYFIELVDYTESVPILVNLDDISTIAREYISDENDIVEDCCKIAFKSKIDILYVEENLYEIHNLIKQAQNPQPYQTK